MVLADGPLVSETSDIQGFLGLLPLTSDKPPTMLACDRSAMRHFPSCFLPVKNQTAWRTLGTDVHPSLVGLKAKGSLSKGKILLDIQGLFRQRYPRVY